MSVEKTETRLAFQATVDYTQMIDAMLAGVRETSMHDPEQGLYISQQALEMAESCGYVDGQIEAEIHIARLRVRRGQYDLSLVSYTRAVALSEKAGNRRGASLAYLGIGYIHAELGEYPIAQQNYQKAYQQALGYAVDMEAVALNNLGTTYIGTGEYEKALEYLKRGLELARRSGNPDKINPVLDSLADLYLRTGQLDLALEHGLESVSLARSSDPDAGENLITLGKIYLEKGEAAQAMSLFQEAAEISEQTQSFRGMIGAWLMIGAVQRQAGRLEESLATLQQAYQLALTEDAPPFKCECLLELSTSYKQARDYKNALECFEAYHGLKEHMFNERSDMRLKTLEVLHQLETARQEAELYQLRTVELQHEIEERTKVETILEEMATHDPLTGLYNRRQFMHLSEVMLAHAAVGQEPLALILFDLDNFKSVNDTYGHLAGDHTLRVLAGRLQALIRQTDVVSRLGGDEFALLLPNTDLLQASSIAERLRGEIEKSAILYSGMKIHLTLSLGVTCLVSGETSIDPLLARADKGLYSAKFNGRNRAEVSSAE